MFPKIEDGRLRPEAVRANFVGWWEWEEIESRLEEVPIEYAVGTGDGCIRLGSSNIEGVSTRMETEDPGRG